MAKGNKSNNRYRKPMIPLDLARIKESLESGPGFWEQAQIAQLFGINWHTLRSTKGFEVPPRTRGLGYHRSAVWSMAQYRQRVVDENYRLYQAKIEHQRARDELREHEWCDVRIVRRMMRRWAQKQM